MCVTDCYFIVNTLDLPFASPIAINHYVYKLKWISVELPYLWCIMYCRPFASKAVFWAILKDFEFAIEGIYLTSICIHIKWFIAITEANGKSSIIIYYKITIGYAHCEIVWAPCSTIYLSTYLLIFLSFVHRQKQTPLN